MVHVMIERNYELYLYKQFNLIIIWTAGAVRVEIHPRITYFQTKTKIYLFYSNLGSINHFKGGRGSSLFLFGIIIFEIKGEIFGPLCQIDYGQRPWPENSVFLILSKRSSYGTQSKALGLLSADIYIKKVDQK